ncbi:MAG: helix-turn-helix transcriptional regulator [Lachnospiraceae bacterium]|nr:helix-turn-helix transcriptional regulator [Lachnospiraceae bacterium]
MRDLRSDWYTQELTDSEADACHRPLEEEYSFYTAVKTGNMDFVRKNLNQGDFTNPEGMGILSKNPLTNMKYHFVVTVAMITRHCVEGGLELEQAYRLSDFYILKMDSCTTTKAIAGLHTDMVLDFTGKMLMLQKNAIISKPIVLCTDYIYAHINGRITINELADYTKLSPSYLSRLFKQNLGISISDYIREKKIEKAKNLLRYSDISLIEIANYLAFSSQSHFIQTFDRYVGLTPKKYRDRYYHKTW